MVKLPSGIIRTSAIKMAGGFKHMETSEDADMLSALMLTRPHAGSAPYIHMNDIPVYCFRKHSQQITNSFKAIDEDWKNLMQKTYKTGEFA